MAYNLTRYNGSTDVPDNGVTAIAGITLPGKNYLGYGSIIDQSLLNMVENFAGNGAPGNPIKGQLWFDTSANVLKCNAGNVSVPWQELLTNGNISVENATVAGTVAASTFTGTFGTITNLGTTELTADVITAVTINGTTVSGNGAGLTAITGANVTGNVPRATLAYSVAGSNVSGQVANALVAGTVYTAAQPAITSVGTLTGLTVSGNITAGNIGVIGISTLGQVGNVRITGGTAGQILTTNGSGTLAWSSTLPSPTTITNITTGAVGTSGTITGQWTLTPGSTLNATYADLAERHHSDAEYPVGTVMTVGGINEVTACKVSELALGVVSDQYAYLMNSEAGPDETHPAVGYLGRVPVRVVGPIAKHQRIAPAGNGVAVAADKNSFGWALESNNEVGEKLVLCLIK